jgi:alanine racemase
VLHRVQASIDRQALGHNLAVAKRYAKGSRLVAAIKANGYGHGLLECAAALQDADLFGVTDINEAERLRAGGTDKEILILQGLIDRSDIPRIAHHNFQVVIHSVEQLGWLEEELAKLTLRAPLTFWLKLDSGMGRLGILPEQFSAACRALQSKPWTRKVVLMTHFASASLPDALLNTTQLERFTAASTALRHVPHETSVASSAVLLALDTAADWARPGLMLYGSSPFAWADTARRHDAFGLRAVMTLQARLISIRDLQAGDNVGYNSQFICPAPMRVGIVSCGYADGYPSCTPNGTPVQLGAQRSSTLGRVSMDMLAIDLTHIPHAQTGDSVELWGKHVALDEVAAHTGILSYNLTCSISARVPLVHV